MVIYLERLRQQFDKYEPALVEFYKEYEYCYPCPKNQKTVIRKCKGWTILMRKVIELPILSGWNNRELLSQIKNSVKNRPNILDRQNEHGYTALMLACARRAGYNKSTYSDSLNRDLIKLLIELGCDVNLQNIDGETALMIASNLTYTEDCLYIVTLLVKAKCNLCLKDKEGKTVMERNLSNKTAQYLKQIFKNNALKLSSLINLCCECIKYNKTVILKQSLKELLIKDLFVILSAYDVFVD